MGNFFIYNKNKNGREQRHGQFMWLISDVAIKRAPIRGHMQTHSKSYPIYYCERMKSSNLRLHFLIIVLSLLARIETFAAANWRWRLAPARAHNCNID